ncbi:hypothetical protein T484DRAFT_1837832 [Baffinella frigidus]|nr:hypothetical protein T484DRAFT_1837832 [Cryptophyta sp. CCMP2293]
MAEQGGVGVPQVSNYKKGGHFARIEIKEVTEATRRVLEIKEVTETTREVLEVDYETAVELRKYDSQMKDRGEARSFDSMTAEQQRSSEARAEKTREVAMDCEMVGTGPDGKDSMLARVAVVNARGRVLYSRFVVPTEPVPSGLTI